MIMGVFTVMMYYMMSSLVNSENVQNMRGSGNVVFLLNIGLGVSTLFSIIFLFYTNSFLMKRRKKEIGLYNILGMEKRHIGRMMFFETLIIASVTIVIGLIFGIVFSKLMFLLLMKLIAAKTIPAFTVPIKALLGTLILFLAIFFLTLLYNLAKIHLTKPIELLHGGELGEKEPKTKIIMTILGLVTMGWGYWFALAVETPFKAIQYFFLAVVLVIIGTYFLFTAGSIAAIKLLRKNKHFYYQTKHFTSVSGMLYRMKQNAVGLANICVLSTMVLVSVATTVCMYAGMDDTIKSTYPNEIAMTALLDSSADTKKVDNALNKLIDENGVQTKNYSAVHLSQLYLQDHDNGTFTVLDTTNYMALYNSGCSVIALMSLDEFNKNNGSNYTLNDGEVLVYTKDQYKNSQFNVDLGDQVRNYKVKEAPKSVSKGLAMGNMANIMKCYLLVVKDMPELEKLQNEVAIASGIDPSDPELTMYKLEYLVQFDTNLTEQKSVELNDKIYEMKVDGAYITSESQFKEKDELHQMYGGFLFIGMFVGILFLMATVLIIYYKQISEGFEDKNRYEIMQKVGMSHAEVKKTIRSQVLMVFFIPLIMAGIHVFVSFRIIKMILAIMSLGNTSLFLMCTIITLLVFCIIYGIVFLLTARSYYKIVSTAE
jgi:putative ABC transport system permease protein